MLLLLVLLLLFMLLILILLVSLLADLVVSIGVNTTAFGRKLTLFSAIPLCRFSLKMSRFFAYLELEKMRSMHSAQRKVELTRLGNQLPVLDKANSFCNIIVKLCVFA